jgi:hypothetical protein
MLVDADNREINSIGDLKNKRIAAVKISEFAGGQSQFWVMMKNGLDYIMDPDQVTFTGKPLLFISTYCYDSTFSPCCCSRSPR